MALRHPPDVHQAGVLARVPTIETDIDRMRAMFEVNTFAPLAVTQAFARLLRVGAEQAGRDAVVLNVGSGAASGLPMMGVYGASKVCPARASGSVSSRGLPAPSRLGQSEACI